MTLQELSNHFKLRERLDRDLGILDSLVAAACPSAQVMTGMPHTSGVSDKVGDLAIEIADMKERVRYLRHEVSQSEEVIAGFVETIEEDYTRMLFRLRFQRGMTWKQVAVAVGGRNTEAGVKAVCYRYLEGLG